jgi:AcrR family transcriptional regulator
LSRRKRPTQERARTTVLSLFAATDDLVRERGFGNVGTRLIAQRAGVSVGSLYQYFPTYEAILLAWYEDVATTAANTMKLATIDILGAPLEIGIRTTVGALLAVLEKHSLVLLRMPAEVPQIEKVIATTSFMFRNRAAMRVFFAQHRQYDPRHTERHIFFLETMLLSLLRRWVLEKPRTVSRAAIIEQSSGLVEAYLKRNATA